MNKWVKGGLIFSAGSLIGFVAGVIGAKKVIEEKCKEEYREEVADLREYYESRIPHKGQKNSEGPEAVGDGTPPTKQVDTHAVDYTKNYDREKADERKKELMERVRKIEESVQNQGPTEDDDRDDEVYQITEDYDEENNEEGYGDKKFFDTIEMEYFLGDGALRISSWGSIDDALIDRAPEDIVNDEDLLVHDILPVLVPIIEDREEEEKYEQIFIRNGKMSIDAAIHIRKGDSLQDII